MMTRCVSAYLMDALFSRSPNGRTLCGMRISVFDLHSRRFFERLLNAGVSSLSIVETSQNEAQKAKVCVNNSISYDYSWRCAGVRGHLFLLFPFYSGCYIIEIVQNNIE